MFTTCGGSQYRPWKEQGSEDVYFNFLQDWQSTELSHFTYTYIRVLSKSGEAYELKATHMKVQGRLGKLLSSILDNGARLPANILRVRGTEVIRAKMAHASSAHSPLRCSYLAAIVISVSRLILVYEVLNSHSHKLTEPQASLLSLRLAQSCLKYTHNLTQVVMNEPAKRNLFVATTQDLPKVRDNFEVDFIATEHVGRMIRV
ncbi:hypothetical protein PR048_017318 [Dryococelus australis]|uniref:Uncharacterized protein n=1 Tax=Dryococelus australis TaxID=614101 RepID=A0ABQ9H967_9NEOP|nr:hypothetical protein PR048_017318 [Dryococelus australis]